MKPQSSLSAVLFPKASRSGSLWFPFLRERPSIRKPRPTPVFLANPALQKGTDSCFQHPTLRAFSTTPSKQNWLAPKRGHTQKNRKGRSRVPTGGSTRGTTVVMGDYGLRMRDHDRRVSAAQLSTGAEAIKKRLRGQKYRLYTRVCANIGVYTSGNETRMGKGKGSFDHWASRIAVSKIIFELKGDLHEQIVRDAFRLAANKMPGLYEFVRKGDPPVMGITKVPEGVRLDEMKRPWIKNPPLDVDASSLPNSQGP